MPHVTSLQLGGQRLGQRLVLSSVLFVSMLPIGVALAVGSFWFDPIIPKGSTVDGGSFLLVPALFLERLAQWVLPFTATSIVGALLAAAGAVVSDTVRWRLLAIMSLFCALPGCFLSPLLPLLC